MSFQKIEPKYRLAFEITQKHCKTAVQKDPCRCVIAQSLHEKYGDNLATVHVLSTKTILVFNSGKIKEYKTPKELREGLKHFDETGKWDLAAGTYHLLPVRWGKSAEYEKERSAERYGNGELHKKRRYVKSGKFKKRPLNRRLINLKEMGKKV